MKIISIEKINKQNNLNDNIITHHADTERKMRITIANQLMVDENARLLDSFLVDKGHRNGKEIHNVYSNGIIKIYNNNTKKFVTVLIARANQVTRYYEVCGIIKYMDSNVIDFCIRHKSIGLNH